MKPVWKAALFIVLLLFVSVSHSQIITGTIVDKDTQETLPGATIYLDGTTISTITDSEGNFRLNSQGINNMLVVSFVGYTTYRLDNPFQYNNRRIKVLLVAEAFGLDEVVVGKGPFSRKEMLAVFRKQFLGESKSGQSCRITNEEDIILFYDVNNNTLHATARHPLRIQNKYLAYDINFDLEEVTVTYRSKSLSPFAMTGSYFSGTTFYTDTSRDGKAFKKRKETYLGSAAHLMRTIANQSWEKEGFVLFVDSFGANPEHYFKVTDTIGLKKVTLIKKPEKAVKKLKNIMITGVSPISESDETELKPAFFNVLYNKDKQSVIDFKVQDIYVDENGNYSPIFGVLFSGYLGTLKAGDMLPMDYYQTIKENKNQ